MKLSHIISALLLPLLALLLVIVFCYTYDEQKQLPFSSDEREFLVRQVRENSGGIGRHISG